MTSRQVALLAHRWVGLVLGLVLAVIGATGSILSYQREIDAALNPTLFRPSGPADPALTYAAVQRLAEAAGRPIGTIRPPDVVWPVWVVAPPRGARGTTAYFDPATGSLLGERDARAGFIGTTRDLHDTLLLREWGGREAVGWLGVLMLLFCATGIWLWWPRDGALGRALVTLRRRPAVLLNLDVHRIVGIWMALVLAVVAFSGVAIIFPGWFRPLLGIAAPAPPGVGPPQRGVSPQPQGGIPTQPQGGVLDHPQGGDRAQPRREATRPDGPREPARFDADAVAAAALAHLPGQVVTGVMLPAGQRPTWTVTLRPADADTEVRGRTFLTIDARSGTVLEERGPRTRSAAEEALALQRWLHGGALLGGAGRFVVFLSGLAMPALFATGLAAWLLRRRNRRRARRQAGQSDPAALSGRTA